MISAQIQLRKRKHHSLRCMFQPESWCLGEEFFPTTMQWLKMKTNTHCGESRWLATPRMWFTKGLREPPTTLELLAIYFPGCFQYCRDISPDKSPTRWGRSPQPPFYVGINSHDIMIFKSCIINLRFMTMKCQDECIYYIYTSFIFLGFSFADPPFPPCNINARSDLNHDPQKGAVCSTFHVNNSSFKV